ncbi:AAA family ATPase [Treponema berlinense]|uniref:AAA family ATPase n=1 Tax=Treponema berlinense TaxID=225004 RepID=UPI0026EE4897|nr:AAA family ATPase [Treponema berlinense]
MGTYFNPGNESFKQAVRSQVYVDKTMLLAETNKLLNTEQKCIALSHARRFGKSQAAGMIDAYYSCGSDSRELFAPFKISKEKDFETHLNKYNVIHVDVASASDYDEEKVVENILSRLLLEFKQEFQNKIDYSQSLHLILNDIYRLTGRKFVIIIDEWDCVVRNQAENKELVRNYLQFLHSLFKSEEAKSFLALAYITGILPIKKIDNESALNNFDEYTMIDSKQFAPYFGFTEDEVHQLCKQYDMNFDSVKKWYNGYLINGQHMYNPNSVFRAMVYRKLDSYWKNTSAFGTINKYIQLNFDGLKEDIMKILEGGKVPVKTNTFQNDLSIINSRDEALTALIHLGYLAYDAERGSAYMPNYEVTEAYQAALATGEWKNIAKIISRCDELLWATIDRDTELAAELIELAHETYTSILKYNDENSLSCVITMAYFTAPAYYNIYRELPSGKGFADIVMIPRADVKNKPAMVIELKHGTPAETAITQIKEKNYTGALKGYGGEVLLVGITYDESKKHTCVIESVTGM